MKNIQKESSIIVQQTEPIKQDYYMASTVLLVVILIISLIALKKLIYIKDEKRDLK